MSWPKFLKSITKSSKCEILHFIYGTILVITLVIIAVMVMQLKIEIEEAVAEFKDLFGIVFNLTESDDSDQFEETTTARFQ